MISRIYLSPVASSLIFFHIAIERVPHKKNLSIYG